MDLILIWQNSIEGQTFISLVRIRTENSAAKELQLNCKTVVGLPSYTLVITSTSMPTP